MLVSGYIMLACLRRNACGRRECHHEQHMHPKSEVSVCDVPLSVPVGVTLLDLAYFAFCARLHDHLLVYKH